MKSKLTCKRVKKAGEKVSPSMRQRVPRTRFQFKHLSNLDNFCAGQARENLVGKLRKAMMVYDNQVSRCPISRSDCIVNLYALHKPKKAV
jgi:hypothetical protein